MKKLMVLMMTGLLVGAWYTTFTSAVEKPMEYKKCLQQAQKNEEKGIYYDAILEYKKALEYDGDNRNIYMKIAEDYRNMGDDSGFVDVCNSAISLDGDNEQAILTLADYYVEQDEKQDAIALLKKHIKKKKNSGALKAKLDSLAGDFQFIGDEYDNISETCNHYMRITSGEDVGILDEDGNSVIRAEYQYIGMFGENGFAPVEKDGEWYYIDTNGYKRRQPDETYEYLGTFNEGVLPAKKNGKYGFLDEDFNEKTEFEYDAATPMLNGIAAVKKDEKWALIDKDLKIITDFGFDDVVRDAWGFCSRNGVVFVKTGEQYQLLNSSGVQIGENYEAVSPFISKNPAAVQQAGKWGFVSSEGEKVLDCMFEKARSFSAIGYAAVQSDESWGFIKSNGDFVVNPQFADAKNFNSSGIAPVLSEGKWKLIQLDIY